MRSASVDLPWSMCAIAAEGAVESVPDAEGDGCERQGCRDDPGGRRGRLAELDPAEPAAKQQEQNRGAGDVHDRGRERDSPRPEAVERRVQHGIHEQVAERHERRDPVRLEAEEGAVQHQHRPVEGEPEREGRECACDHPGLGGVEPSALVDEPRDRLGEDGADDARRHEQERDLPQPEADGVSETRQVVAGREPRERGEQDRRDRDREHPLREHVEPERRLDRARREVRVDVARREERVDRRVEVDQPQPERHRQHQGEDPLHRGVAPVDHHPQPVVAPAQPRERQEKLDHGTCENGARVDVELRVLAVDARHPQDEAEDDREVPEDGRQRRHREVLVAVQDPDDDPGGGEQRDGREEDSRQRDRQRQIDRVERPQGPGRDEYEERRQARQPEQHEPEEARGDSPGTLAIPLLE